MDRGEASIAGSYAVAPLVLQMGEERSDRRGVEVGGVEARRGDLLTVGDESEEQPERVAVGGDGCRADLPLGEEAVGEKLLQGGSEGAHGSAPRNSSRRFPTMAKSSGAASRYQYVDAGSLCPRMADSSGIRASTSACCWCQSTSWRTATVCRRSWLCRHRHNP